MKKNIRYRDFEEEMSLQPSTNFHHLAFLEILMREGWCAKEGISMEDEDGECMRDTFMFIFDYHCPNLPSKKFMEKYSLLRRYEDAEKMAGYKKILSNIFSVSKDQEHFQKRAERVFSGDFLYLIEKYYNETVRHTKHKINARERNRLKGGGAISVMAQRIYLFLKDQSNG